MPTLHFINELEHAILAQLVEQRRLHEGAAEMSVRLPGQLHDIVVLEIRKCGGDLLFDDASADAKWPVAQHAHTLADATGSIPAHRPQGANCRAHCVVLGAMRERRLPPVLDFFPGRTLGPATLGFDSAGSHWRTRLITS